MQPQLVKLISKLWPYFSVRRKIQFWLVFGLILFSSFAEIVGIGSVFPFLGALTSPNDVFSNQLIQPFISFFGLTAPNQLLFPITVTFCLITFVVGSLRLLMLWACTRLSFALGADMSIDIYRRTLYQPYSVHCSLNSSEIINSISSKTNDVIYGVINPTLTLIGGICLSIAIFVSLLLIIPIPGLTAFVGFGICYFTIIKLTRRRLIANSECVARESTRVIKSLQEGLGGIRDVLISGTQSVFCSVYRKADIPLRRAQADSLFISQSPRYFMEVLGMITIAVIAYTTASQHKGIVDVIPTLGALAIGAQRFLPVFQQVFASWTNMLSKQASLRDIIELIERPLPDNKNQKTLKFLPFQHSINISELDFRYNVDNPLVLKKLNLNIPKGAKIGFIGTTGSGKSTLIDLIMGLLFPSGGTIQVDGQEININNCRAWQLHLAHVPQSIFLSDSTIEENIAFGVPTDKIDQERVRIAAKQAQLTETIESLVNKYNTQVGERGIRLSGGQRQRIGIARALYRNADVIIFDEATSALDSETEAEVMASLEALSENLTVLIVAHRLTTLKNCNEIIEIADGQIKRRGTYQEIVGSVK